VDEEGEVGFLMGSTTARPTLTDLLTSVELPPNSIRERASGIQRNVLANSQYLRDPDFTAIGRHDLEFLFDAYDGLFFGGLCRATLDGRTISFRLSSRMTRAGGKTTRYRTLAGVESYEISIASSMLFDGFGKTDRQVKVCGLDCSNRLEALQRIFEHEMVHLAEQLCWVKSDCAAPRFQQIARRLFLHEAHTHNLVTRRERASAAGIRPGSRVTFLFEGKRLTGRVNRITKRVTVLVEDTGGRMFSDGVRYQIYYVPIAHLALAREHA
jgi:hypothetical protein